MGNSLTFKIKERSLECKSLETNPIFQKLRLRIRQFHIINEDYRKNGPTKMQAAAEMKTGVDFSFRVQLHKCLKRLLREVILQKDKNIQTMQLGRVYSWFF